MKPQLQKRVRYTYRGIGDSVDVNDDRLVFRNADGTIELIYDITRFKSALNATVKKVIAECIQFKK